MPPLVVTPGDGALDIYKAVNGINHDIPPAPEGDADLPAGDPLPLPESSFKDNAAVQFGGGVLSGVALGFVPGAGVAAQVATNAG